MDIKATLTQLSDKFEALPTWGKIGVVGGAGLALSWLFQARELSDEEKEWVINYPMPDMETDMTGTIFDPNGGMTGDIGGGSLGGSIGGGATNSEWDNAFNASWEDSYNPNLWGGGGGFGGANWGFMPDWGVDPGYSPKADQLINQPVKIEENLISTEYTNPNYKLYQAQLAYDNATTQAEREAAARAGELARKDGATEAGAQAMWSKAAAGAAMAGAAISGVNSNSRQAALDRALYEAQVKHQNAKTDIERSAAAAAGAAARAAGATDSGADAIWKSNASTSRSSGGSSLGSRNSTQTAVKKAAAATTTAGKAISSSSSVSAANKALQKAQAAYGAAKTSTERAAAAAAGAAARAAGATESGAKAVWKSKK